MATWAQVKNNLMKFCSARVGRFWFRICRTKLQPTFSKSRMDSPWSFPPTGNQRTGGFTKWLLRTLLEDKARNLSIDDAVQWNPRSNKVSNIFRISSQKIFKTFFGSSRAYSHNLGHIVSSLARKSCWGIVTNLAFNSWAFYYNSIHWEQTKLSCLPPW